MLTEAELQQLRGIPLDRLLLRLWPRGSQGGEGGAKRYADILMAKRLGVSLCSMRNWRNGRSLPLPRTFRSVISNFEGEFGVPGELWMCAIAISNYARGYVPASSGTKFIPLTSRAQIYRNEDVIRQYGYQVVLNPVRRVNRGQLVVEAKCLLCQSVRETPLHSLRSGSVGSCKACATRLIRRKNQSGFHGVWLQDRRDSRPWVVNQKSTGIPGSYRSFSDPADAARYYDRCMYKRYGHTLFLNFPDEYDRSNDPVFVPVKRIGDS